MSFVHVIDRPQTLTREFISGRFAALIERAATADAQTWVALYGDWNELSSYVNSEGSRRRYLYTKDVRDAEAEEADRVHREELLPALEEGSAKLVELLLASPHKQAVSERYGPQLLKVLEVEQGPLAPVNADLRLEARQLAKAYDKLNAEAEVTVGGETLTLAKARGLTSSEEPAVRREAWGAWRGWILEHRDEMARTFDELVRVRDQMGRNLEHTNFVPLGYQGMGRTDYGPPESQAFRDAVLAHAVPLYRALRDEQRAALGQETLPPWDLGYHPTLTLPTGAAQPVAEQLEKAQRMFDRLSPRLASHFRRMRDERLIDLENRPGKAAGAYCTSFPDEKKIAIFCNSIGDEDDVRTLCHEMGHAFQGWESQWIEAISLRWATMDMAEVCSMGMEFLTLPYLDAFFSAEQAETFARARWKRAVELLCYVCVVDAFQHWVYENPKASADARDAEWVRLQETFMPGLDWSGDAARFQATRWYAQLHVFRYPFYYIDYAIAETGAMQLALLDAQDHEGCLKTYLELCRLGGTGSVLELFAKAGLRSPFDGELMKDLMAHAGQVLKLQ